MSETDLVRAIRHGVGPDGQALIFMPSYEYYFFNDADLGAMIAYIKGTPPVDSDLPPIQVGPLGRILFLAGQFPLLAAEDINHDSPRPAPVERGATVQYGAYIAVGCTGCTGEGFSGGPIPGTPPDFPPATNITPDTTTGLGAWTEADFFRALREGKRPDGTEIDPFMPWQNSGQMADDELSALWLYLQTVPPKAYGNR